MAKKSKVKSKGNSAPKSAPAKQKSAKDDKIIPMQRVKNAVEKLQSYVETSESDSDKLIDDSELNSQLQMIIVNTDSFSGSTKNFKPKLVNVPHSIFAPWKKASETMVKDFKVLLILKDSDVGSISADDLIDLLPEHIGVDEIISGEDLKTKYKAFEKRRAFIQEFSLILADDAIVTALPKLLGGKAYSKLSTTPIAINTRSDNKFNKTTLSNNIKKVYETKLPVKIPRGNTVNVHLGSFGWFTPKQLSENILAIAEQFIKNFNIRTILLKSNSSPVLPLYVDLDVLDSLVESKGDHSTKEKNTVEIDGIELELSQFEKSLLEIANPEELDTVFAKQIKKAKRKMEEVEQEEKEQSFEKSPKKVKK